MRILPLYIQQVNPQKFYFNDRFFDATLEKFQQAIKTSNDDQSEFTHESVTLLYYFMKIERLEEPNHILSLPIGYYIKERQ